MYSSNITPDKQTGIGGWTDDQIITAVRLGRRPNGERLIPVHPYPVFNGMAAEDLRALVAFLRTVPPVNRPNHAEEDQRADVRERVPAGLARGVRAAGDASGQRADLRAWREESTSCGQWRTAANATRRGESPMRPTTPGSWAVRRRARRAIPCPTSRPTRTPGLTWSEDEIAEYLETGNKPDGDVAGGLMSEVIEGTAAGYKHLTKQDRLAIAKYLKTIPAVRNKVTKQ